MSIRKRQIQPHKENACGQITKSVLQRSFDVLSSGATSIYNYLSQKSETNPDDEMIDLNQDPEFNLEHTGPL